MLQQKCIDTDFEINQYKQGIKGRRNICSREGKVIYPKAFLDLEGRNRYENPKFEYTLNNTYAYYEGDIEMSTKPEKLFHSELKKYFKERVSGLEEYIEPCDESSFGHSTIKNSSVLVSDVLNMLAKTNSKQEVIDSFKNITVNSVNAALKYAARIISYERDTCINEEESLFYYAKKAFPDSRNFNDEEREMHNRLISDLLQDYTEDTKLW